MGIPSLAQRVRVVAVVGWMLSVGCAGGEVDGGSTAAAAPTRCMADDEALSTCLTPKQPASHYVEQSLRYFDAMARAAAADPEVADFSERGRVERQGHLPARLRLVAANARARDGSCR